jgi:hypothetical protein
VRLGGEAGAAILGCFVEFEVLRIEVKPGMSRLATDNLEGVCLFLGGFNVRWVD